jgi:hypothetical protein
MESIIDNLFKKVKKNKGVNRTHFGDYPENRVHQIDLIYLPEDNGFKYALVVVDVGTRKIDADNDGCMLSIGVPTRKNSSVHENRALMGHFGGVRKTRKTARRKT